MPSSWALGKKNVSQRLSLSLLLHLCEASFVPLLLSASDCLAWSIDYNSGSHHLLQVCSVTYTSALYSWELSFFPLVPQSNYFLPHGKFLYW